jgi:hypothetical protein
MQSLSRGWTFLQEAWGMAFKDKDLIKPSIYAMIVGLIVTLIGLVPLVGAYVLLWDTAGLIGRAITVFIGAVLVFVHYVVSYVFSGMTVYLIYGFLAEGDGRMDKAWARVQREFWNIVALAGVSTLVNLFTRQMRRSSARRGGVMSMAGGAAAGLIDTVWTEASFLILPAMMIEDADLATGVKRATQIARGNLLLIGVSTVGVKWITGAISFALSAIGLVLGLGLGYGLIAAFGTGTAGLVVGIGLGALVFFVFIMVASVISSYTMTAYNTCLFLWARDVEKAQVQQGAAIPVHIPAPAPLAAVLQEMGLPATAVR